MKIFFIILGVLALIVIGVLLFSVRVSVTLCFGKENKAEFLLFGKKLKKKEKKEKTQPDLIKKLGLKRVITFLFSKEAGILGRIGYIIKKTVINKFQLNVTVASPDAAQTALTYGGVCAVLYPVAGYLESVMNFKEDNMKIVCDYEGKDSSLYFFTEVKIRIIYLIIAVFTLIPEVTKLLKEVKKDEQ
jgi:hypothetical protein